MHLLLWQKEGEKKTDIVLNMFWNCLNVWQPSNVFKCFSWGSCFSVAFLSCTAAVLSFCGLRPPRPQRLNFLRAPYKLILTAIVQVGKFDKTPALLLVFDCKNKVVENTFPDFWELSVDKSLLQEETDQGGLVVNVPQGSKTLKNAGDAQVVMSVAVDNKQKQIIYMTSVTFTGHNVKSKLLLVKVVESVTPVWRSPDLPCFFIAQLDPIEVQHELVGLQQIFFRSPVFKKTLKQRTSVC